MQASVCLSVRPSVWRIHALYKTAEISSNCKSYHAIVQPHLSFWLSCTFVGGELKNKITKKLSYHRDIPRIMPHCPELNFLCYISVNVSIVSSFGDFKIRNRQPLGRSRSLKVIYFCTDRKPVCDFLLVTNICSISDLDRTVSELSWRIGSNYREWVCRGLTSHSTHYRSFRGRFLQARWPNQQCQSTEGNQLVVEIRLESHQNHSTTLQ